MSKNWADQILDSQIAELCSEYSGLFKRVRHHTEDNLQAWLVVQDLKQRFPPKWKTDSENGLVNQGQLDFLHGLGIRKLKDLTWHQAVVLTDTVLAERRGDEPY